jgi:hypothetical protein
MSSSSPEGNKKSYDDFVFIKEIGEGSYSTVTKKKVD